MDQNSANAATALFAGVSVIVWIAFLALIVLTFVVNWRIVSKAGYSGALSLLLLIPLVGWIMMVVFAFSKWPIEQRLETLGGSTETRV
jgi:uncharacterized membrane protein YhaH (DUF805 family)